MDSITISLLLSMYPIILVILLWYLVKGHNHNKRTKKEFFFLLMFLSLSIFYIAAPDPSLIQKMYVEGGDFTPVIAFSTVSALALFVAVYYGKKHLEA